MRSEDGAWNPPLPPFPTITLPSGLQDFPTAIIMFSAPSSFLLKLPPPMPTSNNSIDCQLHLQIWAFQFQLGPFPLFTIPPHPPSPVCGNLTQPQSLMHPSIHSFTHSLFTACLLYLVQEIQWEDITEKSKKTRERQTLLLSSKII